MSRAIEKVTINTVEEGRLVLGNAQIAATMDIGSSWSKIRIGARCAFSDTGANVVGAPRLCLGVMSNPTAGVGNGPLSGASTGHYVGTYKGASNSDWTYVSGPPVRWTNSSGYGIGSIKKVGSTITNLTTSPAVVMPAADSGYRKCVIVDITKAVGASNSDITIWFPGGTWTSIDHTYASMLAMMETETFTVDGLKTIFGESAAFGTSTSSTVTIDEATDGELNAIVAAWDRTSPTLHISEILFSIWP